MTKRPYTLASLTIVLSTLTVISGTLLASNIASATDDTIVDDVNIIVPTACTLSGTGNTTHNATINPGTYQADIGTTTLKAICNDSNGFAIYAAGYTGSEVGGTNSNKLVGQNTNLTIPTGIGTSGDSQWAMKLATPTSPTPTYPVTIQNSYDSFHTVPNEYDLVAKRTAGTDAGTNATGSTLTTTYAVNIASTQAADTYTGQVKYALVHPNTAPAPLEPVVTDPGYISYNPNDNGVTDSMGDQAIAASQTSAELWASNFQRPGYGFAGWTDKYNWVLNENDADGNGTGANAGYHIYGPNQTISFTTGQYSGDNPGLSLYAVWVPSAGDLQNYTCPNNTTMPVGTVTALTDTRDDQTYTIAKLKDNKCWMVENLRLDNQYTTSAANIAKAQGYNSSFIGLANPETANFINSTTANSLYSTDGSTAAPAITGSYPGYHFPRYNNQNTANPDTNMTGGTANIYSYGNYYTWAAAIAATTHYNNTTSICPSGWHIPTGNTSGEYNTLNTEQNAGATNTSAGLRAYPANFIYSGDFYNSSAGGRGNNGLYWSSTSNNYGSSYYLNFHSSYVAPDTASNMFYGLSIRCLVSTP